MTARALPDDARLSWVLPDRIFDGGELVSGMAVGLAAGRVQRVLPRQVLAAPLQAQAQPLAGCLCPGFLDLQVNGGGDALLNNDPRPETLRRMAEAHRRFGTTGILPTVITDAPEVLEGAVEASLACRGETGLLGLHIEGPHLSRTRRGTHAAEWVRPFEPRTLEIVGRLRAAGVFVMITLAPEAATPDQIAALAELGAVVSLGHTDADSRAVEECLAAGATCFTHLFNAMSPMTSREPGVTGAAIHSQAFAGIICDGLHVDDRMVGIAVRARPVPGRMFLVSDAMSTVGGSDHFTLYGQTIRLQGGRLVNSQGSLAGAHITMAEGLSRLIGQVGLAPDQALAMAITTPAAVLRRPDLARLTGRPVGDVLVLDKGWQVAGTLDRVQPG